MSSLEGIPIPGQASRPLVATLEAVAGRLGLPQALPQGTEAGSVPNVVHPRKIHM